MLPRNLKSPVSWSVWIPPYSKRDIYRLSQRTDLSERPSRGFSRQPRSHRTESFLTISVADSSSRKPPIFRCRWSGSRRWQTDRPCPRPPGRSTPENSPVAWKSRTASNWFRLNRFSNVDVFKKQWISWQKAYSEMLCTIKASPVLKS